MLRRYFSLFLLSSFTLHGASMSDEHGDIPDLILSSTQIINDIRAQIISNPNIETTLIKLRDLQTSSDALEEDTEWLDHFEHIATIVTRLHYSWQTAFYSQTRDANYLEELDGDASYQAYLKFCGLIKQVFDRALAKHRTQHNTLTIFKIPSSPTAIMLINFSGHRVVGATYKTNQSGRTIKQLPSLFGSDGDNVRESVVVIEDGQPFVEQACIVFNQREKMLWLNAIYTGEKSPFPFSVAARAHMLTAFNLRRGYKKIRKELLTNPLSLHTKDSGIFIVLPHEKRAN